MRGNQVGGEVDGYCTKCRMILAHTIVAMVGTKIARVQCNTCMGQHAHRPSLPNAGKKAPSPRIKKERDRHPEEETLPFDAIFQGADLSKARKYSPKERFEKNEIVDHPIFGVGLVENIRMDKVEVVFRLGKKTLIHGRLAT